MAPTTLPSSVTLIKGPLTVPPSPVITHLKLLECLHGLRTKIEQTDGAFGLVDDLSKHTDPSYIRDRRWAAFVSRAADRFEVWWTRVLVPALAEPDTQLRLPDMDAPENDRYVNWPRIHSSGPGPDSYFSQPSRLPPLDVLMVWHSYMLNPRVYMEDCLRLGWGKLWELGMPWEALEQAIDPMTLEYEPRDLVRAAALFQSSTGGLHWDPSEDPETKTFACQRCGRFLTVPYLGLDDAGVHEVATSFSNQQFSMDCPDCGLVITRDSFAIDKMRADIRLLRRSLVPLPGGVLPPELGTPEAYEPEPRSKRSKRDPLNQVPFVSHVMMVNEHHFFHWHLDTCRTLAQVRDLWADMIREKRPGFGVHEVTSSHGSQLSPRERAVMRIHLSRYYNNVSTCFGMDLAGAVLRQTTFVAKMHKIGWIHMAAEPLHATLARFHLKYSRFVEILGELTNRNLKFRPQPSKNPLAVPTLDVDLMWHTHQLSPWLYYKEIVANAGRFVDHDDKIEKTKLSKSFEWTAGHYSKLFGEVYSECLCTFCQACRLGYGDSSRFKRSGKQLASIDFHRRVNNDPAYRQMVADTAHTAHLSTHPTLILPDSYDRRAAQKRLDGLIAKARKNQGTKTRVKVAGSSGMSELRPLDSPFDADLMTYGFYYPAVVSCASGSCGDGYYAGVCGAVGCGGDCGDGCGGDCGGCGGCG